VFLSLGSPPLGFVSPLRPGECELPLHDQRNGGPLLHHPGPAQPQISTGISSTSTSAWLPPLARSSCISSSWSFSTRTTSPSRWTGRRRRWVCYWWRWNSSRSVCASVWISLRRCRGRRRKRRKW